MEELRVKGREREWSFVYEYRSEILSTSGYFSAKHFISFEDDIERGCLTSSR